MFCFKRKLDPETSPPTGGQVQGEVRINNKKALLPKGEAGEWDESTTNNR